MSVTVGADARRRIEDLIGACAHCIDDDRLEDWPGFFADDARYLLTTRENFDAGLPAGIMLCTSRAMMHDRIAALRGANVFEPHVYCHLISAPRIEAGRDGGYDVQTRFAVVRTMQDGKMDVFACGRLLDHVVLDGDAALFKSRIVVCDSRRIDTLIVIPI